MAGWLRKYAQFASFRFERTGHPDYVHVGEKVKKVLLSGDSEDKVAGAIRQASVVVLGQGNVAMDCARILAKGGKALFDTDLASHALPVLGDGVAKISILGRRGHIQAAFTIKEVRELINLEKEGCSAEFHVSEKELELGTTEASKAELAGPQGRPRQRIDKLLRDVATTTSTSQGKCLFFYDRKLTNLPCSSKDFCRFVASGSSGQPKQVHLRFLINPVRFEADSSDSSRLGKVICERTRLEGEPGKQRAVGTGELHEIPAQLALVSIGYRGTPVPGLEPWFDNQRGVVVHQNGRVDPPVPSKLGGLYASGWLKRGPTGIIGTNIPDAKETVVSIVSDLNEDNAMNSVESLGSFLSASGVKVVDWNGYRKIADHEMANRRSEHQPREKITDTDLLVEIASS
jgi:adrenodoxin-NADP+ reductase